MKKYVLALAAPRTLDNNEVHETGSCPIMALKGGFGFWPQPLFALPATSAEIPGPDARMTCDR